MILLHDNYKFPAPPKMVKSTKCIDTVPPAPTKRPSVISYRPEPPLISENDLFDFDMNDYELLGFLSGIVFGILFLLGFVVYVVYAAVKVKSNQSDTSFRGSVHTRTSE